MASRHHRYRALFAEDAERVLRDSIGLRRTIILVNRRLDVTCRTYLALHAVVDAIHEMLPVVAGRQPDFLAADLGLLPLSSDGSER